MPNRNQIPNIEAEIKNFIFLHQAIVETKNRIRFLDVCQWGAPGANVVEMTKWAIPGDVPLGRNVPAMNSFHFLTQTIYVFHCSIIILKIEITQFL